MHSDMIHHSKDILRHRPTFDALHMTILTIYLLRLADRAA